MLTWPAFQSSQRSPSPRRSAVTSGWAGVPRSCRVPARLPLAPGSRSDRCSGCSRASTARRSPTLPLASMRLSPIIRRTSPSPWVPCMASRARASTLRPRNLPLSCGTSRVASNRMSAVPAGDGSCLPREASVPDSLPSQPGTK